VSRKGFAHLSDVAVLKIAVAQGIVILRRRKKQAKQS
jgi:hypothetical protein